MLVQGNVGRVKKLGVVVRESGRGLNNSPKSQLSEITLRLVTLPLVIPQLYDFISVQISEITKNYNQNDVIQGDKIE
jgi:hypothetical protein